MRLLQGCRWIGVGAIALLVLLFAAPASARYGVASAPDGSSWKAWTVGEGDFGASDEGPVHVRRIAPDGTPGIEATIPVAHAADVDAAARPDGGAVVVWRNGSSIELAQVSPAGAVDAVQTAASGLDASASPIVAVGPGGQGVIAGLENAWGGTPEGPQLWAVQLAADGSLGPAKHLDLGLDEGDEVWQLSTAVAPDGTSTLVWTGPTMTGVPVSTARLSSAGSFGSIQTLAPESEGAVALAGGPDGSATIAWNGFEGAYVRVAADGTIGISHSLLPDGANDGGGGPFTGHGVLVDSLDLATDSSGKTTIAWTELNLDASTKVLQVIQVDAGGSATSPQEVASGCGGCDVGDHYIINPLVGSGGGGTAAVVWVSAVLGADREHADLEASRLDASGVPSAAVLLSEAESSLPSNRRVEQQPQGVTGSPAGTFTAIWMRRDEDDEEGEIVRSAIMTNSLSATGTAGTPQLVGLLKDSGPEPEPEPEPEDPEEESEQPSDPDPGSGGGNGTPAPHNNQSPPPQRAPAPSHEHPAPSGDGTAVAGRVAIAKGNTVLLPLRCASNAACRGIAKLVAEVDARGGAGQRERVGRRAQKIVVGKSRFAIAAGHHAAIRIKLNRKGKQLIRQAGKRGLKLRLTGRGLKPHTLRVKPKLRRGEQRSPSA